MIVYEALAACGFNAFERGFILLEVEMISVEEPFYTQVHGDSTRRRRDWI